MGFQISRTASAALLSVMTMGAAGFIMTIGSTTAQAAVWTDQGDYTPGSVVTFSGDNSNGAGYQPGETVDVAVDGPATITQSCDATVDDSGAWSCQITLGTGPSAIGGYTYSATGQTSGVSENGFFTDSGCKDSNALGTILTDPSLTASFSTGGNTATYSVKSANESPSGGAPGLIEYCIYPGSAAPGSAHSLYDSWNAVISSPFANHGYFDFERPNGNPTNLPFDGTTQTVGNATWSGGVPSAQTIVLHINDSAECAALYGGNPGTCFVLPGTGGSQDLQVTKTATPSFTRTYTWGIGKSVDSTRQNVPAGTPATFNYTVSVSHDSGTDSNWKVTGTITVSNPNSAAFAGVNVTDSAGGGATCSVPSGASATIPASGSASFPYTCTYSAAPTPPSQTDTATAAWDASTYNTPDASATAQATADFSKASPHVVDGSVTVTDTLGGSLGTVTSSQASPATLSYPYTFSQDPAGTCTGHNNTATFTTSDTGATGSASQAVTVCTGVDLSVSKTAATAFTRTYNWDISKSVTPSLIEQAGGGTASASYTVTVKQTGITDSAWKVSGDITVTNPNDWEAVTLNGLADAIDNGGTCTVGHGSPGNVNPSTGAIPASSSVDFPYTCTYSSAPTQSSGTNTATATWDATAAATPHGSASGSAGYTFGAPTKTVNLTITPVDTFSHGSGSSTSSLCRLTKTVTPCTLTATDQAPFTSQEYDYSRTLSVPSANCLTYLNTATILQTGQSASASVETCGPAKTGTRPMGYWQNKSGQAIIAGGTATSGVCNSGSWLRQYAPLADLSGTATCSKVVAYVTGIIKAANASGASTNAMLKAQLLATSLDVYFSDPALGGSMIGSPAPVGGVSVDLTKVCNMIDGSGGTATCSASYENASGALGGAGTLTVSQMLAYAAGQSNAGGSLWYGNVTATQALAKNAFDAINNRAVFSP